MSVELRLRILQVSEVDDRAHTMTVEMSVGLGWTEPRLLFNNIVDWQANKHIKVGVYANFFYWAH